MRTAQQLFDESVNFLRQQKKRSINEAGDCVYWNKATNCKCAVGCLIPEKDYNPLIEHQPLQAICEGQYAYLPIHLLEELAPHIGLLERLQHTHDEALVVDWELDWQSHANDYNLIYTSP